MNIPEELKYTEEHNWVQALPNGNARAGITSYAQTQLGDIVFVHFPRWARPSTRGRPWA